MFENGCLDITLRQKERHSGESRNPEKVDEVWRKNLRLVWYEPHSDMKSAIAREKAINAWKRL